MESHLERHRPPSARRPLLAISALVAGALLGAAMPVAAMPVAERQAERLHSTLARIAKQANRDVKPPAGRLARTLPAAADRIQGLREPALTGQAQIRIALDELGQMAAPATLDPHYLRALVAAGRAHLAISGQDPLTATTINPEYRGLEPELAGAAGQLERAASDAAKLSSHVKRLTRSLVVTRRRARQLKQKVRRTRAPDARQARR